MDFLACPRHKAKVGLHRDTVGFYATSDTPGEALPHPPILTCVCLQSGPTIKVQVVLVKPNLPGLTLRATFPTLVLPPSISTYPPSDFKVTG